MSRLGFFLPREGREAFFYPGRTGAVIQEAVSTLPSFSHVEVMLPVYRVLLMMAACPGSSQHPAQRNRPSWQRSQRVGLNLLCTTHSGSTEEWLTHDITQAINRLLKSGAASQHALPQAWASTVPQSPFSISNWKGCQDINCLSLDYFSSHRTSLAPVPLGSGTTKLGEMYTRGTFWSQESLGALVLFFFFFNSVMLCGLWDLNSPTRDWTQAHGSENTES